MRLTVPSLALFICATAFAGREFEVVSIRHAGNARDGERIEGGTVYVRQGRRQFKGGRLALEDRLTSIIEFGFASSVVSFDFDSPPWMNEEFYRIEAVAPAGTTLDGAKSMVQTVLTQRLGLQYHQVEREKPIYTLVRGTGELKLTPSTEVEPNPGAHSMGAFRNKSATLADFAAFVSGMTGRKVIDKTGIPGRYKFNVDWSQEIHNPRDMDQGIALTGVKWLGLKLEPGKERVKVFVIDRANREPTPN